MCRIVGGCVLAAGLFLNLYLQAAPPAQPSSHDPAFYGPALEIGKHLKIGQTIDVAVHNGYLYIIGGYFEGGTLYVADISNPTEPRIVGQLAGLGNLRQIECAGSFAYIAARDDGLYIVDISDPENPRQRSHYDTLEKATGVAVSHPVVAIANRHYGVELVDVSDPDHPRFLCNPVWNREAQSVDVRNGFLYVGVWASREVITVDIRDPHRPAVTGRVSLDGYGDGMRATATHLFAATGHHAASHAGAHDVAGQTLGESGFGAGHGLEIFSLAHPERPSFVSRLKTPPFYKGMPDMWSVETSGGLSVLSDVFNGIFVVDVTAPESPRFVGHVCLPWVDGRKERDAVAAVACGEGVIYAAGYYSGLYVVPCPGIEPVASRALGPPLSPEGRSDAGSVSGEMRYVLDGQARAVVLVDRRRAAVAAGNGGIHLIEFESGVRMLSKTPTKGIAYDVAVRGNCLFVAEGTDGVTAWHIQDDFSLSLLGRYAPAGMSARQVVSAERHPYLLLDNPGRYQYRFEILDISRPGQIHRVLSERGPGMLHGYEISTRLHGGRYAALYWQVGGPVWYDLEQSPPRRLTELSEVLGIRLDGICMLENGVSLAFHSGGCSVIDPQNRARLADYPSFRFQGERPMAGPVTVLGSTVAIAAGASRSVCLLDMADAGRPRVLETIRTKGPPGRVGGAASFLLIPEGHEGVSVHRRE